MSVADKPPSLCGILLQSLELTKTVVVDHLVEMHVCRVLATVPHIYIHCPM